MTSVGKFRRILILVMALLPVGSPAVAEDESASVAAKSHELEVGSDSARKSPVEQASDSVAVGDPVRKKTSETAKKSSQQVVHSAPSAASLALKKRLQDADSGILYGVLPRNVIRWVSSKKPLRLESDVVVEGGQVLEIGPGVQVRLAARDRSPMGDADWADSQFVSLMVRGGTLRILGTSENPVRFVPERTGSGPRWGGVEIVGTRTRTQAEIVWAEFPGALIGIHFERAAAAVRHVVVSDGNMGFVVRGGSAPEILNCVVARNHVAGLHSEKSGPTVRSCLFLDNAGPGARFEGVGLARLDHNAFWNNAGGDIVHGPAGAGGWKTDSVGVPDESGNLRADPVLRSSPMHAKLLAHLQDSLKTAPIWKRRLPDAPEGHGPWALSPFSPLVDHGSGSVVCRDNDGTACDIGLWGGRD